MTHAKLSLFKLLSLGQMILNGVAISSDENMRSLDLPLGLTNIIMPGYYLIAICHYCRRRSSQRLPVVVQQHKITIAKLLIFSHVSLITQYLLKPRGVAPYTSLSNVIPFFVGALGGEILYELIQILCCYGTQADESSRPLVPDLPGSDSGNNSNHSTTGTPYQVIKIVDEVIDSNNEEGTPLAGAVFLYG